MQLTMFKRLHGEKTKKCRWVKQVYELDHAIGDLPYKEQQPVMNYPIHIEWKDKDQKRMTAASRKDYKKWKEENPDLARDINIKRERSGQ